ncbi:MAG: IS5 family transposase [Rickettsia endosymbiont of Bryobia graminum]|nr:IS5 family transposase [Rickettsia endosymbiont of Bryobia graminum]
MGRGKGGLSPKIHATCHVFGNSSGFHLSAGQAYDLLGADALMDEMTKANAVLADKAYEAGARMRNKMGEKGITAVSPAKKNRVNPIDYDKHLYKALHLIENVFGKLKQDRAIATRYDKTSQNFLGAIYMAATVIWLN